MVWPSFPDYGCFPRWPENGQAWIHPDDVATVTRYLPSERVLRRESFDGTYYHYRYGDVRFRLRPCLWLKVAAEGLDIGDQVETIGVGMERELFTAKICGMYFVRRKGRLLYRVCRLGKPVPRLYLADELRLLTNKDRVRPSVGRHPAPQWKGESPAGERWKLD